MSDVQVVLNVGLTNLAFELASQARDGLTYQDILDFIEEIDGAIMDSEFSARLLMLAKRLATEA